MTNIAEVIAMPVAMVKPSRQKLIQFPSQVAGGRLQAVV
jgi:hypothetical protein